MLRERDDLVCDFAQTYGITDLDELPVETLAALAAGLPMESRSKMRITGQRLPINTQLLAACLDRLSMLVWMQSEDGQKRRNRPKSVLEELMRDHNEDYKGFDTFADFEAARNRILKGG